MSNGIDFVIGGKDNAKPAMASVEQGLSRLEAGTSRLTTATQGLMSAMAPLLAVYAAVKTAMAAIGGVQAANAQFDTTAEAVKGLEVALKIQGAAVETESARLQNYADSMQSVTGINDSVVMGLMKEASLLGVTSDKLDDMTTAAIGLAEATGSDTSTAMTQLRMATEGVFTSFNRSIPQLKHMATDEEKLAAVLELAAKGFEAKATWANKTAEAGAMAGNALDKLKESVGAILAPFRALISTGIATLANALTQLLVPAVAYAEEMLANIGPMMDWVKEKVIAGVNGIIAAFTFLEVTLKNLDQLWIYVESYVELTMRQIGETIMYTLVEVIPAYVMWFGKNIINLFKDAWNGVLQVYYNATRMIAEIMLELWEFVVNDMGAGSAALGERIGAILASGLTTGFESALTDLPDIAVRVLSEREKELAQTLGDIGDNLGGEFAEKMKARMVGAAAGIGDGINKEFELGLNAAGELQNKNQAKRKDGTFGASINATESRLLTRGPSSTYEQRMMAATEKIGQILLRTGEWVKATKEELEEMRKQDPKKIRFVPVQ